ncbi:hypothetical protein DPMN_133420 [Dreissena polymorpha]|uniref:Uncharacterized protein n=1 Tax=Dreissena polymorpha TaxID=45954 RepID=A0A9D4FXV4_DREPO|nr:hypothetical protein DPMN_133420 [Dreissena polymorpha]
MTAYPDDQERLSDVLTKYGKHCVMQPSSEIGQNGPCSGIFELIQDIIRTNLLTKFHEDRKINVASLDHVFQPTSIIFELFQDIMRIGNKYFTKAIYSHIRKNAPPLGSHVFQANVTIFKLIQDIIQTNLLTKFHEDWTINVASRVLTSKTAPPPGGHVFSPIWSIFEVVRDINETNVLTKFHDDWAKIVTSSVFTSFVLNRGIIGTNVLTKFHEDQVINVASRVFTRQNVDEGRQTKSDHKSSP